MKALEKRQKQSAGMKCDLAGSAGLPVLRIRGAVDLGASPTLAKLLDSIVRPGLRGVILDLTHTGNIGFGGIATLVQGAKNARRFGARLHLLRPPASLIRLLRTVHLEGFFPVLDAEADLEGDAPYGVPDDPRWGSGGREAPHRPGRRGSRSAARPVRTRGPAGSRTLPVPA